jgi:hypothetical protein
LKRRLKNRPKNGTLVYVRLPGVRDFGFGLDFADGFVLL